MLAITTNAWLDAISRRLISLTVTDACVLASIDVLLGLASQGSQTRQSVGNMELSTRVWQRCSTLIAPDSGRSRTSLTLSEIQRDDHLPRRVARLPAAH